MTDRIDARPPAPPPSQPVSYRADPAPFRASDFQAALRLAGERHERDPEPEPTPADPKAAKREDGLRRLIRGRKDEEEAGAGSHPGEGHRNAKPVQAAEGKIDQIAAAAHGPHGATAFAEAPALQPAGANLEAFAAMLEKAYVTAGADGGRSLSLKFGEQAWPVTGVAMQRLADGSLSLTLAANGHAVPQVNRSLEALRKRLEARGLTMADLQVEVDDDEALRLIGRV